MGRCAKLISAKPISIIDIIGCLYVTCNDSSRVCIKLKNRNSIICLNTDFLSEADEHPSGWWTN